MNREGCAGINFAKGVRVFLVSAALKKISVSRRALPRPHLSLDAEDAHFTPAIILRPLDSGVREVESRLLASRVCPRSFMRTSDA